MARRPFKHINLDVFIVVVIVVIVTVIQPIIGVQSTWAFCWRRAGRRAVRWRRARAFHQQWGILGAVCSLRRRRRDRSTYFTSTLAQPAVNAPVAAKQLDKVGDKLARHVLPFVEQLVALASDPLLHGTYVLLDSTHLYTGQQQSTIPTSNSFTAPTCSLTAPTCTRPATVNYTNI